MSHLTAVDGAAGQPSSKQLSFLTNLTSGIEIEVLSYGPRGIDPDFHVADALCKPVLLECSKCSRSHAWKLPYLGLVDTKNLPPGSTYTFWNTTYDDSAQPDRDELRLVPEGSEFYPLEIVSRIMNFDKPTPCPLGQRYPCTGEVFEWDAQTEIFSVMQRVYEAFSGPGFCLAINRNTGLHIHFGHGKEKPPVHVTLGMFGIFAVLERHFDSMLTCSRVPILPFNGHPNCGIHRPSAVYKYDQNMEENRWIGSLAYVFLQNFRISVNAMTSGRMGDPQAQRRTAVRLLKAANAPGMLTDISWFDDVGSFMNYHPNLRLDGFRHSRYLAINLTNLYTEEGPPPDPEDKKCSKKNKNDDDIEKGTVEIRLNSGTMDPSEVWATYDFMGKIMLWLSTPGIDHNKVILDLWTDSNSTLLDVIKLVGASQTTIDYYTDRLSSDWAVRRHSRLASRIDANDPFKAFKHAIENNRLKDSRREAVDAKIQQKLESGYYGQMSDALFQTLPGEIQNHPDSYIMNMDTCDYGRWFDNAVADHKAATIRY